MHIERREIEVGAPSRLLPVDEEAEEARVDRAKRARLRRVAALYLEKHRLLDSPCRFDVVALVPKAGGRDWDIELFQNAF